MPRPVLVLLLAALAAGGLLWYALGHGDPGGRKEPSEALATPVAERIVRGDSEAVELEAAATGVELPEPHVAGAPGAGEAALAAPTREVAAAPAVSPQGDRVPERVRVQVVAGVGGPPAVGVRVRTGSTPKSRTDPGGTVHPLPVLTDGAALQELVEKSRPAYTDEQGFVNVLASESERVVVVADHAGRIGHVVLEPDAGGGTPERETVLLVLEPELAIVARVVDDAGQPVGGASVRLKSRAGERVWQHPVARSDPETGEARLPNLRAVLQREADPGSWFLELDVLTARPQVQHIDPAALPTEPVEFVMPPAGSVEVEVFGLLGERLSRGGMITLGLAGDTLDGAPVMQNHGGTHRVQMLMAEKTRFEHVALGQELGVQYSRGFSGTPTRGVVGGPVRAGETVTTQLHLGEGVPVARLRLLDPAGVPVADEGVSVRVLRDDSDARDFRSVVTDDDGRFAIEFLGPPWTGQLVITRGEHEQASVEVYRPFPIGPTELGDVVLVGDPVIVSGRAVGLDGEGVEGLSIELSAWLGSSWMPLSYLPTQRHRTGAEGEFLLRGPHKYERYRLQLTGEGLLSQFVEFDVGTEGLVVPLATAGALVGSVWLPDEFESQEELAAENFVALLLVPEGQRRPGLSFPHQVLLGEDGGFLFESVRPGVYSFALGTKQGVSPLYQVEGVVVAPGQPTRDPRLDPLDLRGTLHAWRLRLDGTLREEGTSGYLTYGEADSGERPLYLSIRSEELLLLSPFAAVDADMVLYGFRPMQLRGIQDDTVVQLKPGLPVRVVLTGQAALLEPPYELSVALPPDEPGWHATDNDAAVFGEARELLVRCEGAGQRRLRWIVSRQREGGTGALRKRTRTVDAEPLRVVEIQETLQEQRIEVLWTAQEADRLRALFDDD